MRVTTYRNNRNPHKFLDVKHTADRHYMWRQRIAFDNGVTNPVGTPQGGFRRQSKATIDEVLKDYKEMIL
jgi:hypothetical protein